MPASSREIKLCSYLYDPLDRQTGSTPVAHSATHRFYCKDRLTTEVQGVAKTSIFQHDDQLLAQQQHQSAKVDTTLLATDQQRSVLIALDATRPHRLAYSPYGHRPAGNGLLSLLGFNGERPDPVTGHYHLGNGYRQFNPVLMRFNSPDSWSPFGEGGLNAYAYCVGNPISWRDPTGHFGVSAEFFDSIFQNVYLYMKNPLRVLIGDAAKSTETLFGGVDNLKIIAKDRDLHPDVLIARALSQKNTTSFVESVPVDEAAGIDYLHRANEYLITTLHEIRLKDKLLTQHNKYINLLSDTEQRNLQIDLFTYKKELARVTTHISTLRIEGPSTFASYFDVQDFVKTANKIRDSR
jgi:RHS repeat-associated protein